jgi:hypothetical protein
MILIQKSPVECQAEKAVEKLVVTGHWRSISDLTLTLKQAIKTDAQWAYMTEHEAKKSFRHFMNLLNRTIFGLKAVQRHQRRLRVIAVVEKEESGRRNIHAAIEPPLHLTVAEFEQAIILCWHKVDWGHRNILIRHKADGGWIKYMLKRRQKSSLDA